MDVDDQVAAAGEGRRGRLGAWLPRPAGIRNGELLLVLVGLAAVMALVDRPLEPVDRGRGGGIFQHLPPPVGITRLPPATPPGGGQLSAPVIGAARGDVVSGQAGSGDGDGGSGSRP